MSPQPAPSPGERAWEAAHWAALLLSVDPVGLGGAVVRAASGPVRDRWAAQLQALQPPGQPWRRMPAGVADDRLLGGLDLTATLQQGRPVAQQGLLAESHGGFVLVPMAERLSAATAARLAQVLDQREVGFERDGLSRRWPCHLGLLLLDEGTAEDPPVPARLRERLAFVLDLQPVGLRDVGEDPPGSHSAEMAQDVALARQRLPGVTVSPDVVEALCATALSLGVEGLPASLMAVRAARASAALHGRGTTVEEDAAWAARLVLAPRATRLPAPEPGPQPEPQEPEQATAPPDAPPDAPTDAAPAAPASPEAPPPAPATPPQDAPLEATPLEDRLVAEVQAALPAGWLAALQSQERVREAGRVGALSASSRGGRPAGSRAGRPRGGARLNLVETLRAAAPWQPVRRRAAAGRSDPRRPIHVESGDLRISRRVQRAATATLFVIDASGSSALHRLGEAKGAVNLLLADCYVRRDQVGVIAFRGQAAEVLLPPTRSLARARRSLAALPGGGGTPLAAGLEAAAHMASQVRRAGAAPVMVLLTDGRANIARNGEPGRAQAQEDALRAARQIRQMGLTALLVDTSPRPAPAGLELAAALGAQYRALPHAGAAELSSAVQAMTRPGGPVR